MKGHRLTPEIGRQRAADMREALSDGHGFNWLAKRWGLSGPGAYSHCYASLTVDELRAIGENGKVSRRPNFYLNTGKRLQLVALGRAAGWSMTAIAQGMGISPSALLLWIKHNAPHGLAEVLEDYTEEAEAA